MASRCSFYTKSTRDNHVKMYLFVNIHFLVRYMLEGSRYTLPLTRETIWCQKGKKYQEMGIYQPENDQYHVVSVSKGMCNSIPPVNRL